MNEPALPSAPTPPPLLDAAPSSLPVSRIRWWIFFGLIGFYPLAVGLIAWGRPETHGPALSHNTRGLLIVCAAELFIFAALFTVAWLFSRASLDELRLRWRGGIWIIPLGFAYSIGVRLAVAFVAIIGAVVLLLTHIVTMQSLQNFVFNNRPDVETLVDVSALRDNPLYFWLTLTLVSFVMAGLREELWRSAFLAGTRSLWPGVFGSRAGQIAAAALAAVIFGLGHLPQGMLAVFLTGFLGFILGVIMILHRSIWPAVIAHGAFDATSLAMLPLALDAVHKLHPA